MENPFDNIHTPNDLKQLSTEELVEVADQLRGYIIRMVSSHPGHLGASLGTVELTVALHYVFNTPYDRIIWDVGHQAYGHKILTGRKELFATNRTYGGISGFPCMAESEYDAFGAGHSSTSISAALGMATASVLKGEKDRQHIAVIGDGAMTGGLAFEGLNNAGVSRSNILVVLNDNGMSIDASRGALSRYFTRMTASKSYNNFKDSVWDMMGGNTRQYYPKRFISKISGALKSLISPQAGNLFEALNFRYFGPIDGHDLPTLIAVLQDLKTIQGPKLLHVVTKKGKGLKEAEAAPTLYHAPGKFDLKTGKLIPSGINLSLAPKYQDVFGKTIIELARMNPKIVGITPAMPTGCSLSMMMKKMPERVFDVGIAEQHAVTFSAGLAAEGMVPFCNIYSSFAQRAYDQIIHDVALQKLPVVFCLDRAGLVGEDGATHHGAFDLAFLRPIPDLIVASPMNERELRNLMYTAQLPDNRLPFVIRYPRGRGVTPRWKTPLEIQPVGKGVCLQEGRDTAILSIGHIGNNALKAIEKAQKENPKLSVGLYNMIYLKPLDEALLHKVFKLYSRIITLEDGVINGGLASAVCEFAARNRYTQEIIPLGLPDRFVTHGSVEDLHKECGIDVDSIANILLKK
ncbi:MAG: 1-deoxy-D-xylulose-5-phosphate synthase [Bacteroides sp.]|nr:1-deoxy-D-xylulose-5-phosphate synthase [Ruminococcus flavefaciens]MCM1555331.1 1-deoxy-D-xylulose-5-phosphate synthase [Bacteroides sp.]